MDIRNLVPEHILQITPYQPGKPIEEVQRELGVTDCIKLASNENPLGPSPKALAALQNALPTINFYPDGGCFYLKAALAQKHRVAPGQIFVGNGSDEVIELLMRTVLTPADDVVLSQYSFIVYKLTAQAIGANMIMVVPKSDYSHDLMAMAAAITPKTKMVCLDNPNNPLGTMVTKAEFDAFMQRVPEHVLVVSDEAYAEYIDAPDYPDSMTYLTQGRRIAILHTFSKIYGLSGLRIGYGLMPAELTDAENRIRPPFNVNLLAQVAALAALDDIDHLSNSRQANAVGKAYLYQAFERNGIAYYPSQGNFITINLKQNAAPINQRLLQQGVIVRPIGGYGLPNHLRITIGTQTQNERLVHALQNALDEKIA